MTDKLKVIKPFFIMEKGDEFEKNADNMYVSTYSSEYSLNNAYDHADSTYKSSFEISEDYAKSLIEDGYLQEVTPKEKHTNVFDEISLLKNEYTKQYANLDEDYAELPACLKVEKETTLSNMIKLLSHLESLKK